METSAINEPKAKVERPVMPCPMVQPSANTPPIPMIEPPTMWRIMSPASVKDSMRNSPDILAMTKAPAMMPPTVAMPKLMVEPVKVIRYWRPSPTGAMKVKEATGTGSKSSAPHTPVTYQAAGINAPIISPAIIFLPEARNSGLLKQKPNRPPAKIRVTVNRAASGESGVRDARKPGMPWVFRSMAVRSIMVRSSSSTRASPIKPLSVI